MMNALNMPQEEAMIEDRVELSDLNKYKEEMLAALAQFKE